jgi:hypothetical protein
LLFFSIKKLTASTRDLKILAHQVHHVVITVPHTGWTAVGLNSFRFEVIVNSNLMKGLAVWAAGHWFDFVIAGIVMIAVVLSCYYCCCNCKKFNPEENQ